MKTSLAVSISFIVSLLVTYPCSGYDLIISPGPAQAVCPEQGLEYTVQSSDVGVRLNNGVCSPSSWGGIIKRVGPYSNTEFSIIGPQAVCANQAADFRPSFITSDLTGYQWSAPSGWSYSGQGTPYFSVSVPYPFYGGAITLRLQNRCGLTNTPYVLNLYNTCYGFSASPNPVGDILVISELDPEKEATATLIDNNSKAFAEAKSKKGMIEMDVSKVPNGLYLLMVKQQDKSDTRQILVSH